jgi:hypothetical protein
MQLSEKIKYTVLFLTKEELSQRKISVSQSTVSKTLAKNIKYDSIKHMGGNGHNKTVTSQISQAIMKKRKENPKTSL